MIKPTAMYKSETWTLIKKKQEINLECCERKLLTAIYAGEKIPDGWRRWTKQGIETLYVLSKNKMENQIHMWRWLGHIEGLNTERMEKMRLHRTLISKRRRGRPRRRWLDNVLSGTGKTELEGESKGWEGMQQDNWPGSTRLIELMYDISDKHLRRKQGEAYFIVEEHQKQNYHFETL